MDADLLAALARPFKRYVTVGHGEQRIVDTAGQVERFMKRLERRQSETAKREIENKARAEAEEAARKARARGDDPDAAAAEVMNKYGL